MISKRAFIGFILLLFIMAGFMGYAWMKRPRVIEISPGDGTSNVPVTAQIRMEFSQSMDHDSVTNHIIIEPAQEGEYRWEGNMLLFTPEHSWSSGQAITVYLEEGARAANPFTFPMRGNRWLFTTRVHYLAYLWPSDSEADIYTLNPETGEIQQYTHHMGVLEFTANNHGNKIYFSASNGRGGTDLYEIDLIEETNSINDSYRPRKLMECGSAQCRNPAVSSNGKSLAYEHLSADIQGSYGPAQVWLLDLVNLQITPVGKATEETVQPSWSSTGWLALYNRTNQVYEAINPETQARIQLGNQTGQAGNWSPDGEYYLAPEIMYTPASDEAEIGISHLFRYAIRSGSSSDLSKANEVEDVEGVYSPGGEYIAFARKYLDIERWTLGRQIWIMTHDGSDAHPITAEPDYNHYDFAWSRDKQLLAYVRFNQAMIYEPPELWMIEASGKNAVQLVIGGYTPLWIP